MIVLAEAARRRVLCRSSWSRRLLLLYGEANRGLSYLSGLRESTVEVREIPAAHFLFYDAPVATLHAIGDFVQAHAAR